MTATPEASNPPAPSKLRSLLVDFCLALSFANLAFYRVWQSYLSPENDYFGASVPRLILGAVILDVLLLAGIGFVLLRFARGARGRWARVFDWGVFALLMVFGPQRLYTIQSIDRIADHLGTICYAGAAIIIAVLFTIWPETLKRFAAATLLILSPFALVTISQAAWKTAGPTPATMKAKSSAPRFTTNPSRRVVWIVFDEMDYTMAFEKRPANLQLPELDRLRSESWFATNVLPPADGTLISMPALITGLPLNWTQPVAGNDIELHLQDVNDPVRLGSQSTVFTDASSRKLNSAVVGWYHHYCRVIGNQLASCADTGSRFDEMGVCPDCAPSLVTAMGDASLRLLPYHTDRMTDYRDRWLQSAGIRDFQRLRKAALSAVSDPNLGLVLLHLPVPHYPFIYSRTTRGFISERGTYVDNLALADRTLGELRRAMEQAGTWQTTTLIVTADHWWRYNLYAKGHQLNGDPVIYGFHVPLIVHLPGSVSQITYTLPLNNRMLREAIVALLDHPQWTTADFSHWVDSNRERYPWDFVVHMYTQY